MLRDIDLVIAQVRRLHPEVKIEQLPVRHPGVDDDGLWLFGLENIRESIQVESSTGAGPFLVEHDGMQQSGAALADPHTTVWLVADYLTKLKQHQAPAPTGDG